MNIRTFTISAIVFLSIAASLFISGIIALTLVPIIVASISVFLASILFTYLIDHIIYPVANTARMDKVTDYKINDKVLSNTNTQTNKVINNKMPSEQQIPNNTYDSQNINTLIDELQHLRNMPILKNGATILHAAIQEGLIQIALKIIKKGDFIHVSGQDGRTPLHIAALNGCTEIAKALIDKGVNVNATDAYTETVLHMAAKGGYAEIVSCLIAAKADINAIQYRGYTPLSFAIYGGHIEIVKKLISAGLSIYDKGHDRWSPATPLHLAIKAGRIDIVELLIEKNADIEAQSGDPYNSTPMLIAIRNGRHDIVNILFDKGAVIHDHYLHEACDKGQVDIVKLLIQKGVKVNALDTGNNIPLLYAMHGIEFNPEKEDAYLEIAELLIQEGADVNYYNLGVSMLHLASMEGSNIAIVKLLIQAGANVNAAVHKDSTCYEMMIEEFPNVKSIPITPLLCAMYNNLVDDNLAMALTIIHHGKVPYSDIPIIEGNSTSNYIQKQYKLATDSSLGLKSENPKGLFFADFPLAKRGHTMAQFNIFVKHSGAKDVYPLTLKLLRNGRGLSAELIGKVMSYVGLFPKNLDLSPLVPIPSSSNSMVPAKSSSKSLFNQGSNENKDDLTLSKTALLKDF